MPRIRTVKPEFWTSESNGRLSRDARLVFLALLNHADDEGRFGASSRGLASLLLPFDEDARGLMDGWMSELEREGKVRRWVADGNVYGEICNFAKHQKVDRPSRSKLPPFDEASRIFAKAREASCEDQGSGIRDQVPTTCSPPAPAEAPTATATEHPRAEVVVDSNKFNSGFFWGETRKLRAERRPDLLAETKQPKGFGRWYAMATRSIAPTEAYSAFVALGRGYWAFLEDDAFARSSWAMAVFMSEAVWKPRIHRLTTKRGAA